MVTELLVVWIVGVVTFFALWAILLKVIKRVSERKHKDDTARKDADPLETMPEQRS
jgi:flagellar biosynthesis/type III secretory pathway M-ring protein FliF/YscJ